MFTKKTVTAVLGFVLIVFMADFALSSTNIYNYSYGDPASLVTAAGKMIMNADYNPLLDITEQTEKKKTQETIDNIKNNPSFLDELKKQSSDLLEFDVINTEIYTNDTDNQLSVVSIKWKIKLEQPGNNSDNMQLQQSGNPDLIGKTNTQSEVYVDYLLKLFNGKWKIISTRTVN